MKDTCSKCGLPRGGRKDRYCKTCRYEYTKAWRKAHPEWLATKHVEDSKRWQKANRERVNAWARRRRAQIGGLPQARDEATALREAVA